jgi:hypothetical protein
MRFSAIVLATALALLAICAASAQDQPAGAEPKQQMLDAAQLDQLVAPIALYPDPLLAQVLMASTYPLEIVQADRFAKANKKLKGDKLSETLAKQDWDESVKQLVSTPTVLATMSDKLDWTEALGDAVLAQQADVMDAIQRLRAQAQANGKLETTKQQKVTVTQAADKSIIEIEPASPEVIYVPYYNPAVVYGEWSYPDYPPYYFPPAPGYVVGGAIATGLAWGAAIAIGHEIWDNFDWRRGDINVKVDRNVNVDVDRNFKKWEHNSYHRRGVNYNNDAVRNKFANANARSGDRKLDYRGRSGEQVLNAGKGGVKPGGVERPNLGGGRPGGKPDVGQIQQGLKERAGKQAALEGKKPDLGKAKAKSRPGGSAFDIGDGPKAKDFSKRGQASLGNRGAAQFSRPSGGGAKAVRAGGGPPRVASGGRGGGHISRGGGGRGGGRRSDIRLKEDLVPLLQLGNGLELYRFRYIGRDQTVYVGVVAQTCKKSSPVRSGARMMDI